MNIQKLQDFCRGIPGATEDIKWGDHLVFSVGKKMFAVFGAEGGLLAFKASDDKFEPLTRRKGIIPAPYAARYGWVSVLERGALTDAEAKARVRTSYELVLAKLPKRLREQIAPVKSPAVAGARAKRSGTRSPRP
jgi:predicted DNA-binding protein (MmcQ/YjbR family)